MNRLGFPNTYTFSKCVCEHLLLRANAKGDSSDNGGSIDNGGVAETIIIRPSIVGPSVSSPHEGWEGEFPSTIVAVACLYLKFPYNVWCFGKESVPFAPVDVVCRFIISRSFSCARLVQDGRDTGSFSDEDEKKEALFSDYDAIEGIKCPKATIKTVAWDASSPASASFLWVSYAFAITHLGAFCGHVDQAIAYIGLLLSTIIFSHLNFSTEKFRRMHSALVRTPLDTVLEMCPRLPLVARSKMFCDLRALSSAVDLPLLFHPFANQSFHFSSELVAPKDFDGTGYMFRCAVAAHRFVQKIEQQRSSGKHR